MINFHPIISMAAWVTLRVELKKTLLGPGGEV